MTLIIRAERAALEGFARAVIEDHQSDDNVLCKSCHLFAPCPVELAALDAGLIEGQPTGFLGDMQWKVTESSEGAIVCETDWRRFGRGHIVVFDREAVFNGKDPDPMPDSPQTREAWAAARRWVQRQAADGIW